MLDSRDQGLVWFLRSFGGFECGVQGLRLKPTLLHTVYPALRRNVGALSIRIGFWGLLIVTV